ncbi:hypothetical protein GA0115258_1175169 [Streptomyces sp. LamerLS-31b]|nr:hypothetical protein GA0115258_1175169 [Streptomyces sp. LamerLS-31b]
MVQAGRSLLECKHLSADWLPAFTALPRSNFLPDVIWPFNMGTGTIAVDRHDEPDLGGGSVAVHPASRLR